MISIELCDFHLPFTHLLETVSIVTADGRIIVVSSIFYMYFFSFKYHNFSKNLFN